MKMDIFSLEDDGNEMFITQEDSGIQNDSQIGSILGDENDFQSPCRGVFDVGGMLYSDISDEDSNYEMTSLQVKIQPETSEGRWVKVNLLVRNCYQ